MSEKHTCEGRVWHSFSLRSHACGKTAKMEHEGKWYCGIHDPVKRAGKRAERDAAWEAKWNAERAAIRRAADLTAARAAVVEAAKQESAYEEQGSENALRLAREIRRAAVRRLRELEGEG